MRPAQIRKPKSEARRKPEIRNSNSLSEDSNPLAQASFRFRPWNLRAAGEILWLPFVIEGPWRAEVLKWNLLGLLFIGAVVFNLGSKAHRCGGHFAVIGRFDETADGLIDDAVFQGGCLARLGNLRCGSDLVG